MNPSKTNPTVKRPNKKQKNVYIYKTVESRKISFDTRVAYLSQSNQEEFQR